MNGSQSALSWLPVAFFVGFPFRVAVGYAWRDRISRALRPAGRSDSGLSALAIAEENGIPHATIDRARKEANGSNDPIAKRTGKDVKRRKMPTKSKL